MLVRRLSVMFVTLLSMLILSTTALAEGASDDNHWYYDTVLACKHDKGYTQGESLKENDPHYGWKIGKFVISGFTSRTEGETPVFLKNVGDQITLSFILGQNIDKLNGDDKLVVWKDYNGYDKYFEVGKTDFGRGMLIVRHTDYQNNTREPTKTKDYLALVNVGTEDVVNLCEEGDYEVALDYEIHNTNWYGALDYHDYRIFFKFKVRNSNTMLFLFDTKTGDELYNGSVTENGFRIDTANSHYLDIRVKKDVLNETRDGLVDDTRFNRSATNGSEFAEPGIYTVTARNPTTGDEPTTKVIYVGEDDLLKASVVNGMTVSEVQQQLEKGATVASDGTLVRVSAGEGSSRVNDGAEDGEGEPENETRSGENETRGFPYIPIIAVLITTMGGAAATIALRKQKTKPNRSVVAEGDTAAEGEQTHKGGELR